MSSTALYNSSIGSPGAFSSHSPSSGTGRQMSRSPLASGTRRPHTAGSSPSKHPHRHTTPQFKSPEDQLQRKKIVVACRCRPLFDRELQKGCTPIIQVEGNQTFITEPSAANNAGQPGEEIPFTYDLSYQDRTGGRDEQERIVNDIGGLMLATAWQGYNVSVCAFGASCTGKTYTLFGLGDRPGLIERFAEELFMKISLSREPNTVYEVTISMLEIYMERVRDLLAAPKDLPEDPKEKKYMLGSPKSDHAGLRVREHPQHGPYVEGLTIAAVKSVGEVARLLEEGEANVKLDSRKVWSNHVRGHVLVQLGLVQKTTHTQGVRQSEETKYCKVTFADLAEREVPVSSPHTPKYHLKEAHHTNKSLIHLGNCLRAVGQMNVERGKTSHHFPYRGSPLTMLLKDSFVGFGKSIVLVSLSPADAHFDDTFATLQFGQRAYSDLTTTVSARTLKVNKKRLNEMIEELERLLAEEQIHFLSARDELDALKKTHAELLAKIKSDVTEERERNANLISLQEDNSYLKSQTEEFELQLRDLRDKLNHALGLSKEQISEKERIREEIEELKRRLARPYAIPPASDAGSTSSPGSTMDDRKRRRAVIYRYRKGDPIDKLVAYWVNSTDYVIPDNFGQSGVDQYDFGQKKITLKILDEKLMVRVGGGWQHFPEYLEKYGFIEQHKWARSAQGQAWLAEQAQKPADKQRFRSLGGEDDMSNH